MKFCLFFVGLLVIATISEAQIATGTLSPGTEYENISSQALNSDSNVTSVVIWIKQEVKPHYHATHSEHVYVLEGTAKMLLGENTMDIKAGDLIFIPEKTIHAVRVTSANALKVLSIQAPYYDGKDRVAVDKSW